MPYKSQAQERWAHTESGKKALGASGVKEWDSASKGLKLPKRVTEHPKHFEVEPHEGPSFKVAKKGLSPKVLHRMQGMCMGGAVKMADGGKVPDTYDPALEPQAAKDFWAQYEPQLKADDAAIPKLGNDFVPQGMSSQAIVSGPDVGAGAPMQTVPIGQLSATPTPGVAGADASAQAFGQGAQGTGGSGAPEVSPVVAPAPKVGGGGYGVNEQKELKEADAKKMAGASEAADVQAKLGQQEAQAMQAHQDAMLAKQAIHDEQAKKIQAEIENTENEIKNGKIDPGHWYASKDTGGKISAALAMVLGGLGAGLTKGPNMGLEMINKQIDRDISAQKDNLQSKNNLVAMYYKKLGNLDEATQRAKADMQAALQVKVAQLGALAKGDAAKANLKMFEGQLQEQRLKLGSDLATAATGRALQNIHIAVGKQQLAAGQQAQTQQAQAQQIMDRLYAGTGTAQDQAQLDALSGGKASERIVSTPEGGRALAHDAKSAEKYREADSAFRPVRQSIQELKDIEQKLNIATLDPAVRHSIETRRNFLIMELPKVIGGVNRLNENELHLADKSVADAMNSITTRRGATAALDTLENLVTEKQGAMADTYLIRPSANRKKIDRTTATGG